MGSALAFVVGMSVARCTIVPSGVCPDWGVLKWFLPALIVAVAGAAAYGFAPIGTLLGRRFVRRS